MVPAVPHAPQDPRNRWGAYKKKGRLRCHKRPKSREETPKEGSDSGNATACPMDKTIAIGGSIERKGHGPIRRFIALALKADHFRTWRRPSLPAHYVEYVIALDRHRVSVTTTDQRQAAHTLRPGLGFRYTQGICRQGRGRLASSRRRHLMTRCKNSLCDRWGP